MTTDNNGGEKVVKIVPPQKVVRGMFILAISGSLLLLAMFATELKQYKYIGSDATTQATISVSGDGDAYATPNIAAVSFSITEDAKTIADARKVVDAKMAAIHKFLNTSGVAEKDIKGNYSFYPKYDNVGQPCAMNAMSTGVSPCYTYGKQVLTGYEVSESVDIVIRNIDTAGTIVAGLADNGATNMSGPNFTVENEDGVKADARGIAIDKAEANAHVLADKLGVTLGRIVSFNEGGNYPMAYGGMTMKAMAADAAAPSEAANIPAGQNKYTSNVTIVYEIK